MASDLSKIAADYGLTPQAAIALVTYVDTGDEALAAKAAGVSEAYVTDLIFRNPEAKAALITEVERRFGAGAVIGYRTLVELAKKADTDAVRKAAAVALIERGHGKEPSRVDHYVHRDEAELVERITELITSLGLSPEAIKKLPHVQVLDMEPVRVDKSKGEHILPPPTAEDFEPEDDFMSLPLSPPEAGTEEPDGS